MNRAAAPVTSIEEMSLNRRWAAPKLPRLSFNHLAVSGCTVAVPPFNQLRRLSDSSPGRGGVSPPGRDRRRQPPRRALRGAGSPDGLRRCAPRRPRSAPRKQGLLDALDGVDHSSSSEHLPRRPSTALYVGMGWMAVVAIVPLVWSLPVSVT